MDDIDADPVGLVSSMSNARLMMLYALMEHEMVERGIITYAEDNTRVVDISKVRQPRRVQEADSPAANPRSPFGA